MDYFDKTNHPPATRSPGDLLVFTPYRFCEIVWVLTMIATNFIPLTFIVGLYGMNVEHEQSPWAMSELGWYYGYPLVWSLKIIIVLGILVYFKHKHWL
ncbi:MAG: hypothetical protein OEZ58_01730 [Gammaproteobacteria bacterium]|nr:hypothetical protein [Gammaproteobacteria bacterium]MDH5727681.1 hypothetical protein [Gammaproteobacteria bacterium]